MFNLLPPWLGVLVVAVALSVSTTLCNMLQFTYNVLSDDADIAVYCARVAGAQGQSVDCVRFAEAVCDDERNAYDEYEACLQLMIDTRYNQYNGNVAATLCAGFALLSPTSPVGDGEQTFTWRPVPWVEEYVIFVTSTSGLRVSNLINNTFQTTIDVGTSSSSEERLDVTVLARVDLITNDNEPVCGWSGTLQRVPRADAEAPENAPIIRRAPNDNPNPPVGQNPPISQPEQPPVFPEPTPWAICGNATCEAGENSTTCPVDCGAPPPDAPYSPVCGNEICEVGEDSNTCSRDCPLPLPAPVCGNAICEGGEDTSTCEADCPAG